MTAGRDMGQERDMGHIYRYMSRLSRLILHIAVPFVPFVPLMSRLNVPVKGRK